jgi:ribosomal protein L40E
MAFVTTFYSVFVLAAGLMVFALAYVVLLGRWISGDEHGLGVAIRGVLLFAAALLALSLFGTIWYWLVLPLALLPLVEVAWGAGLAAPHINRKRQERLAEVTATAVGQPDNPIHRLNLARALLETGQVEIGLAEIDEAVAFADGESRSLIEELAQEAKDELLSACPSCGSLNAPASKICRRCYSAMTDGEALRALVCLLRPVLRLLPSRR